MKTFKIDIHPKLLNVEVTVKNGACFTKKLIAGDYQEFLFTTNEKDAERIKKFAREYGNDNYSKNEEDWYYHCNGYAMDLCVNSRGFFGINTYRSYGVAYGDINSQVLK